MDLAKATLLIDQTISLVQDDPALVEALTRFRDSNLLSGIAGGLSPEEPLGDEVEFDLYEDALARAIPEAEKGDASPELLEQLNCLLEQVEQIDASWTASDHGGSGYDGGSGDGADDLGIVGPWED